MNRIDKLFAEKKQNILSIYFTAGHPEKDSTQKIIHELQSSGADMIEIGIPFSDPLADGPVIQQSSQQALQNGMSIKLLFEQLKDIRKTIKIPLLLMGYSNPVLHFGFENFCQKAQECGIDGLILPDLPLQEYKEQYKSITKKYGLHFIMLVSPQTSPERIKQIDETGSGFIYFVSSSSTTGIKNTINHNQEEYFKSIKALNLKLPVLIGFGISNHATFSTACKYANGAIIGSAFIETLNNKKPIKQFINEIIN